MAHADGVNLIVILLWAMGLAMGASAAWALHWAVRQREFTDFPKAARTIFDSDEPEGMVTDRFPERAR